MGNCASTLFTSGLLRSNDNRALADTVLVLAKKLCSSQCVALTYSQVLPPLSKVLAHFSLMDTDESSLTTELVMRVVGFVSKAMGTLEAEEVPALAPATADLKKSLAVALYNSENESVYTPIFKQIKAEISQLNSEVNKYRPESLIRA